MGLGIIVGGSVIETIALTTNAPRLRVTGITEAVIGGVLVCVSLLRRSNTL